MRRIALGVLIVVAAGCTDRKMPVAATAIAGPTPLLTTPSLPTTVPGVLSLVMPIQPGDAASTLVGIAPFGYHAAGHAENGHSGWDIEYRSGAAVRAAADGTVQSVSIDESTGRATVEIEHIVGTHHYRTVYTGLVTIASDIMVNAAVGAGQSIGTAAGISHFQLDDFEYYRDVPSPNAVSPEPFLSAAGKSLFEALWSRASYPEELVEPFATNPRDLAFPASRTWMREGGDGIAGIALTRRSARSTTYDYAVLTESGTAIETGTATVSASAQPFATIDLVSPTSRRLGIYDVVSNEMKLVLGEVGAARPASFAKAGVYRTTR